MYHNSLQDLVFQKILAHFPKKAVAVEKLSDLLGTGKDAIYRRLRGDTLLTPDELSKLALVFNISVDALIFEKADTVFFNFNTFAQKNNSFRDYLEGIDQNLERVLKLPNPKLYYASAEIPIFHYCFFPELIAFKLYVWGKTVWDLDYLREQQFDFDLLSFPTQQLTQKILHAYQELPSVELWSLNIVDNTLNQIEYTLSSGGFHDENDALLLTEKLMDLTQHMQRMAAQARKFLLKDSNEVAHSSFDLFHNEMVYTNNTLYVNSPVARTVFASFTNPNFITSTDEKICDYIEAWFLRLIAKSNPISSHAEKNRHWFFNGLRRKIQLSKKHMEYRIATH